MQNGAHVKTFYTDQDTDMDPDTDTWNSSLRLISFYVKIPSEKLLGNESRKNTPSRIPHQKFSCGYPWTWVPHFSQVEHQSACQQTSRLWVLAPDPQLELSTCQQMPFQINHKLIFKLL